MLEGLTFRASLAGPVDVSVITIGCLLDLPHEERSSWWPDGEGLPFGGCGVVTQPSALPFPHMHCPLANAKRGVDASYPGTTLAQGFFHDHAKALARPLPMFEPSSLLHDDWASNSPGDDGDSTATRRTHTWISFKKNLNCLTSWKYGMSPDDIQQGPDAPGEHGTCVQGNQAPLGSLNREAGDIGV